MTTDAFFEVANTLMETLSTGIQESISNYLLDVTLTLDCEDIFEDITQVDIDGFISCVDSYFDDRLLSNVAKVVLTGVKLSF